MRLTLFRRLCKSEEAGGTSTGIIRGAVKRRDVFHGLWQKAKDVCTNYATFIASSPVRFPECETPVKKSRPSTSYRLHLEYSTPPPRLELEDESLTSDAENVDPNSNTQLATR